MPCPCRRFPGLRAWCGWRWGGPHRGEGGSVCPWGVGASLGAPSVWPAVFLGSRTVPYPPLPFQKPHLKILQKQSNRNKYMYKTNLKKQTKQNQAKQTNPKYPKANVYMYRDLMFCNFVASRYAFPSPGHIRVLFILPLIEILKFDWLRQLLYAAILCFLTNLIILIYPLHVTYWPHITFLNPFHLSLIHIWRCRRYAVCRSRWSPYH